jgi:hypothetical protein
MTKLKNNINRKIQIMCFLYFKNLVNFYNSLYSKSGLLPFSRYADKLSRMYTN